MALRWAKAGHEVWIGSRDAARAADKAQELSAEGHGTVHGDANEAVVGNVDLALLSVPYSAHRATLQGLASALAGRILFDITVPLKPPAVRKVQLPQGQSAALEAQALLGPGVRVVAGLHHVSSVHLANLDHTIDCDVLVCSDDAEALASCMELVKDLGLRPIHAGALCNAIALESLTPVLLHLNKHYKGTGAGLRITGI